MTLNFRMANVDLDLLPPRVEINRLFDELKDTIYRSAGMDGQRLNRYSAGSLADPTAYPENGNRSYELTEHAPKAGVLMIHGLGDSPYALRSLADRLHRRGCWVVGLRLREGGDVNVRDAGVFPLGLADGPAHDLHACEPLRGGELQDFLQ
jgi:hypothetical protein